MLPSGTYAMTGATSALPSAWAIRVDSSSTRALCLPSVMYGPFCSVPPMGTSTVVAPSATRAASSGLVSDSISTGGAADAPCVASSIAVTASSHCLRKIIRQS